MASNVVVKVAASGTGDAMLVTGATTLYGVSMRETAATAAVAEAIIRDGTDNNGAEVVQLAVGSDAGVTYWFGPQGIRMNTGIRVDRISGTSAISVYHG